MEHVVESHVYSSVLIGGKEIPFITDAVINMWIVMAIIMILTLVITRKLKPVPEGGQKVAEVIVEFINNMSKNQIGHHWKHFAPYMGTVMIFLAVANSISIFNIIPSGHNFAVWFNNPALEHFSFSLHPPTRNFNTTLCLALMSMAVVVYAEFKFKGVKGWIRSFYKPTPVSALVKLLDYFIRPISLCLRLFGNILGGVIVMTLIYSTAPLFAPVAVGIYFDLFDAGLQAYVFVFLTMLYIAEAVEEE